MWEAVFYFENLFLPPAPALVRSPSVAGDPAVVRGVALAEVPVHRVQAWGRKGGTQKCALIHKKS